MKQIVVIGCGRFGMSLSTTLKKLENEVMVINKDEEVCDTNNPDGLFHLNSA